MKHTYIIEIDWRHIIGREYRTLLRDTVIEYGTITSETQRYLDVKYEEATALELHSFLSEIEAYEGEIKVVEEGL